jgi:protein TonB
MGVYVHDRNWGSRRGIAFMAIVVFHIFLIYGLKSGFAAKVMESIAPPIVTEILKEDKDEDKPPPPPPPKVEIPPVEVPPPVVDITIPIETTTTTALSNVTDKPLPPPPKPVERSVVKVLPKLNTRASQPDWEEYYPPSSKRLGEAGTSIIKVCLDEKAKVTDATVQETSGFPRLDEAAVKIAKVYRYLPGTEDGKPVASCFAYRLTWKLKD